MQGRKRRATEAPKKTQTKVRTFKSNVTDLLRRFITLGHLGPGEIILGFLSFSDLESLKLAEKALQSPSTLAMLKQFALQPAIVGKTVQAATDKQRAVKYPEAKTVLAITEEISKDIQIRINEMQRLLNVPVNCDIYWNIYTTPYTAVKLNELRHLVNYKRLFDRQNKYNFAIREWIQDNPVSADLIYKSRIVKATCSDLTIQSKKEDSRGLKVVLKYFKDVNRHDEKGFTALACAAASGRLQNVKFLIQAGADISITCKTGSIWAFDNSPVVNTPKQFAEENGHGAVALFLSQKEKEKEEIEMLFDSDEQTNEQPNNQCCIM